MTKNNFWLGFIIYLSIFSLGHLRHGSIDAIQRLHLTRSIIFNHSMITDRYGPIKYSPLQSILMIPPYLLGYGIGKAIGYEDERAYGVSYRFCAFFFNPVITTLICLIYFNILLNFNIHLSNALLSTYLLLFGTLLLPYSRIMFSENLSALLIIISFYLLLMNQQEKSIKNSLLNFFAIGLLCLNNIVFAIFYMITFFYTFQNTYRVDKVHIRVIGSIGLLIFLLMMGIWGSYNYARYGNPFLFGYINEGFTNRLLIGLYGLTFSIGRGIIFYSPLTVLGYIYFLMKYQNVVQNACNLLFLFIFSSLVYLFIFSKWHSFEGGWSWGSRFLIPFIPVIHITLPFIINRYRSQNYLTKWLLVAVFVYALLINAYEFLGVWQKYEVKMFKTGEFPYRWSIFDPIYSVLFNNWEWQAFLKRFPQFLIVGIASFYFLFFHYKRKFRLRTPLEAEESSKLGEPT